MPRFSNVTDGVLMPLISYGIDVFVCGWFMLGDEEVFYAAESEWDWLVLNATGFGR